MSRLKRWNLLTRENKPGIVDVEHPWELSLLDDTSFWEGNWSPTRAVFTVEDFKTVRDFLEWFVLNRSEYKVLYRSPDDVKENIERLYAQSTFYSVLSSTARIYTLRIQGFEENKDKIKSLNADVKSSGSSSSVSGSDSTSTNTSQSDNSGTASDISESNRLNKFNDTRGSADNADLTTDKYLTNSSRDNSDNFNTNEFTNASSSSQSNVNESSSDAVSEYENVVSSNNQLERLMLLDRAISDTYAEWAKEFDKIISII